MAANIFIDGGAGTTGLEIRDRLAGRAELTLITLDEAQRKQPQARRDALNAADLVILCLPDEAARESVALIDNPHTRVIDASTAHRTAPGWAYGFPEIVGRDVVAQAMRVSNPGCYSTGFIALVAPLVQAGLIPVDWPLTCNAVSGYSGGGRAMIAAYEGSEAVSAWRGYALTLAHKHIPEMQVHCGLTHMPLFEPAVVPTCRGMIVDVPLPLAALPGHPSAAQIRQAYVRFYAGSACVCLAEQAVEAVTVEQMAGRDSLEIFVFANANNTQTRLVAALDNLGKGAGGAAVQNLNLMLGLDETAGLLVSD